MNPGLQVETFKFWDVVSQCVRATVQGEDSACRLDATGLRRPSFWFSRAKQAVST